MPFNNSWSQALAEYIQYVKMIFHVVAGKEKEYTIRIPLCRSQITLTFGAGLIQSFLAGLYVYMTA